MKKSLPICRGVVPWMGDGGGDARRRRDLRQPFQLHRPGRTGRGGPPAAVDLQDCEYGAGGAVGRICGALFGDGAAVGAAGEAAAGDAVAGVLFAALGATVDGRIEYDLLFRWFVGIGIDDPVWDHSSFSKNRDRLLEGEIADAPSVAVLTSYLRAVRLIRSARTMDGSSSTTSTRVTARPRARTWPRWSPSAVSP